MFSDPTIADLFTRNQLGSFRQLWDNKTDWFEAPNEGKNKNSWSGVSKITLEGQDFFIKKQKNYKKANLLHPFGENLAHKEFKNITLFKKFKIPSLDVAFFGMEKSKGNHYAILITKSLSSYLPLSVIEKNLSSKELSQHQKREIIIHCAKLISLTHEKKIKIQSLYSKHVFVHKSLVKKDYQGSKDLPCKFIDLERARISYFDKDSSLKDIEIFDRRTKNWSQTDRLCFLITYLGAKKVTQKVRDYIKQLKAIQK
ncbi:lipopolysaccharide kinase InaA family protein [Lentisphaera marina]|uniref:lipopolysaccharide kinase InaA family protein n=1 Tax=Lentisphaera marina TaxID=1111041 RepID=UPI0023651DEE|nr:lipopolysaccharide kinase InaA family protein [Lentisphaera marina]MDD7985867.1 lipopolysaccharide kinase InaA family protein [Lentisphaera marina]